MRKGTPHFKKDGTLYKGKAHRMDSKSRWMTGKTHTKSSVYLYKFSELSNTVKKKVKKVK